jgi:phosphatidylinositol-3-phosphatase
VKFKFLALVCLALIGVGCGGGSNPAMSRQIIPGTGGRPVAHVFLVIEENQSFSTVYHNQMPWLSAVGDKYGVATNYFSDEEGSLLDYLWLSSGSGELISGCGGNDCSQVITGDNIFRQMIKAGISWKVYADSLPKAGFMGLASGNYVKRHNPAAWYSDVVNDPHQQQNIVPINQLQVDLAKDTLPTYSIIVPDLAHDAHNGTPKAADAWLTHNVGPLLNSRHFQAGSNSVLFITFDNADRDTQGQVLTVVAGEHVIPRSKVDTPFRHENTLRTMLDLLGINDYPGASASAASMSEFFR